MTRVLAFVFHGELVSERFPRVVLIGGPGHGKSTLGQYVAMIHRAILLQRLDDFNGELPTSFKPNRLRIPFRVVLKYFAQWLSEAHQIDSLEAYLAELVQRGSSRATTPDDVQEIFKRNPCLLVLDGLDEVIDSKLRVKTLERIWEFLSRTEHLQANLQVVATSRPTGYSREFNPEVFLHFDLLDLSNDRATTYAKRWVQAKKLSSEEGQRVLATFEECQEAEHTRQLLTTPLQVTIVLLIIKDKGQPPSQREALFHKYWETILSREKAKAKDIIKSEEGLLFNLHGFLGYLLHRRATRRNVRSLLPKDEFLKEVRRFLRAIDRRTPEDSINQRAEQLVTEASTRLVLIVEPQPGLFGFELRSFQEFFAAAHMVQSAKDTSQRFARLKAIVLSDYWRNVALFFAGRIVRTNVGEAGGILELVCRPLDRQRDNRLLKPGAWLALEIAADRTLAANRDLQYNTLEYGLTVLEESLSPDQMQKLVRIVGSLSRDDKDDILRPIFRGVIHRAHLRLLGNALRAYSSALGDDDVLRGGLERYFASSDRKHRNSAVFVALRAEANAEWLARVCSVHAQVRGELILQIPWGLSGPNTPYLVELLDGIALTNDEANELLANSQGFFPWHVATTPRLHDPSTPGQQFGAGLDLLNLIDSLPWKTDLRLEPTGMLPPTSSEETEEEESAIRWLQDAAGFVDAALSRQDIVPALRGLLWAAKLAAADCSRDTIDEFIADVPRLGLSTNFWDRNLRSHWPLHRHAAVMLANGQPLPEGLKPFLVPAEQQTLARMLRDAIDRALEHTPSGDRMILTSAIRLEDDEEVCRRVPDIRRTADPMGLASVELINLFVHGSWFPKERTRVEVEFCIKSLERRLTDAHTGMGIRFLAMGRWPDQKSLWKKALGLLLRLAYQVQDPSLDYVHSVPLLLAKVVCHYPEAWRNAPAVLRWLSQISTDLPPGRYHSPSIHIGPVHRLSAVSRFLTGQDSRTRRGAAIFGAALALALGSSSSRSGRHPNEFSDRVRFEWKGPLRMAEENDTSLSRYGMAMLPNCDLPVNSTTVRRKFLSILRRNSQEDPSWAAFVLQNVRVRQSTKGAWIRLLRESLEAPQDYPGEVLSAAMGRFIALSGPSDPVIQNEEELGLPLATAI